MHLVSELASEWLRQLNGTAESLQHYYAPGKLRVETYREIAECIVCHVRGGLNVCAVTYGHPGVFSHPMHEAIRQTRREGFPATMLPAISAEDCLFADLGVDPGASGCQSFDATDFLIYRRRFDPASALILWQIGATGELGTDSTRFASGVRVLAEVLARSYGEGHETIVYEAAEHPFCEPSIQPFPLRELPNARISSTSTLYVPPKAPPPLDEDMLHRLGIQLPQRI